MTTETAEQKIHATRSQTMSTHNTTAQRALPELPEAMLNLRFGYDAHQMRAYANAAIAHFLVSTGQYVTNDASREAAIADAIAKDSAAHESVAHRLLDEWREATCRMELTASERIDLLQLICAARQLQPADSSTPEFIAVRSDAIDWFKTYYPALCEKSGLCERIAGRLYTRTTSRQSQPAASLREQEELAREEGWMPFNGYTVDDDFQESVDGEDLPTLATGWQWRPVVRVVYPDAQRLGREKGETS
jgi:hypothetical protein